MLKPLKIKFKGLVTVTGPTKSGKSQLAEFLIKDQVSITYIATSTPRKNDREWNKRINLHRKRRPKDWKLIEPPLDICHVINTICKDETILLDSLGGLVEQHLQKTESQWELFQNKFLNSLITNYLGIIVVTEEIGWGVIPATPVGHLFRERLSYLSSLICRNSKQKWLAINGTAIDLSKIGYLIP
tara:strand:- start:161 stop:718 length:558 start_codon:yes stop_codon:yes gene_type:complete